ncbi:MAG: hypothetical protein FWF95_01260 [Syntrophorhabdaceae bacterium]|nr:hypothetical protein [Syntrophorhabdaceae bacterium]
MTGNILMKTGKVKKKKAFPSLLKNSVAYVCVGLTWIRLIAFGVGDPSPKKNKNINSGFIFY